MNFPRKGTLLDRKARRRGADIGFDSTWELLMQRLKLLQKDLLLLRFFAFVRKNQEEKFELSIKTTTLLLQNVRQHTTENCSLLVKVYL